MYLQVFAALHQILNIIYRWKEKVQNMKELVFFFWKSRICQQFHHIAKVIATDEVIVQWDMLANSNMTRYSRIYYYDLF